MSFVKKAFKEITRPFKQVAKAIAKPFMPDIPDTPTVQAPPPPAAEVVAPSDKKADAEMDKETNAAKKKAARGGKKSLTVSRSSGSGLNI